jgi:pyruvate,orthophosphate dikinase
MNDARKAVAKAKGIAIPADVEALGRAVPDTMLGVEELKGVCVAFKRIIAEQIGREFPTDPYEQLKGAILAVFRSWNNDRAILYRKMNGIPDDWGTAVNVQSMVFGNMGETSATGVCFTTGAQHGREDFFGEWLRTRRARTSSPASAPAAPIAKGQGEAGTSSRRPCPRLTSSSSPSRRSSRSSTGTCRNRVHDRRQDALLLQTRNGKRAGRAEVKIAVVW